MELCFPQKALLNRTIGFHDKVRFYEKFILHGKVHSTISLKGTVHCFHGILTVYDNLLSSRPTSFL